MPGFVHKYLTMDIQKIEFITSSTNIKQCPGGNLPEYAFIGRSNVGKSSLINMLASRKNIAYMSGKPGKTQTINHFLVDDRWYLVDLPGYGYSKVSKKQRKSWAGFTKEYLTNRTNLYGVFALIDSRIPPQKSDIDFIYNLGYNQIPFVIIFTKIDKLNQSQLNNSIIAFKEALSGYFEEFPVYFMASAIKYTGKEAILNFIEEVNNSINVIDQ